MANIYLYRKINALHTIHPNPYIFNLENALSKNFSIINNNDNKIGVLELFKYLFKADIFYFNWIETLPQNRYGKFQSIVLFCFLLIARLFKKKVIWTLHNKYSHNKRKNAWTDFMYRILITHSDLILTHSQSGVDFIEANYPKFLSKIKYIIHPVSDLLLPLSAVPKTYDFLIWGEIQPYKGIVEFLKFVNEKKDVQSYKIMITGKCDDKGYKAEISRYLSENIILDDSFHTLEEIAELVNQTKFVLFTYKLSSILSSGSLMDSIRMRSVIIGPNEGAFKDLNKYKFIYTYGNFEDIVGIYNDYKHIISSYESDISEFCNENTWDEFAKKLYIEVIKIT